jgi:hypothetical protein
MTQDKKFKQSVRARMAETGEAYVRARNALLGQAEQPEAVIIDRLHRMRDLQKTMGDPLGLMFDAESWAATGGTEEERQEVLRDAERLANDLPRVLEIEMPFNAGWYFHDAQYPDEGSVGPYASLEEAKGAARMAEYNPDDPDSVVFIEQEKAASLVQRYVAEHLRREVARTLYAAQEPVATADLRKTLESRIRVALHDLMRKIEGDGVDVPLRGDFDFELLTSAAEREQGVVRGRVWIRHPERYPDLVRDLVDAGLLEHRHLLSTELEKRSQENRRARVPQWASQDRECTVEILPSVLDSMVRMADEAHPLMTGAALYGSYSDDQEHMWVEGIAPLSSDSESGPSHFHRGTEGLAGFFADLFERTKGETYYLGEFITHPGGTAIPSPQDAATQLETAADPACQCQAPVLVVFGGIPDERDIGVFVYTRSRGQIVLRRPE